MASSTMPPPTATVSAACASGVSPSATAAAMPPCAHADDAPSPSGAAEINVTGRGASLSAQNNPASPPPTMTTSSERVRVWMVLCMAVSIYSAVVPARPLCVSLVLQINHPLDRAPCALRKRGIDRDLFTKHQQALQNVGERDALHVRADVAG